MDKPKKAKKTVLESPRKKNDKRRARSTLTPPRDGATAERMRQASRHIPKEEKRQRRMMGDAEERIDELTKENDALREHIDELTAQLNNQGGNSGQAKPKWRRGVLPGNQYIKTDESGHFEKITKQEWDAII